MIVIDWIRRLMSHPEPSEYPKRPDAETRLKLVEDETRFLRTLLEKIVNPVQTQIAALETLVTTLTALASDISGGSMVAPADVTNLTTAVTALSTATATLQAAIAPAPAPASNPPTS